MLLRKYLLYGFCCVSLLGFSQKKYFHKAYYKNGQLKEQGWIKKNQKNGYWKFYDQNGRLESEGRFINNKPNKY